jgi:hypothetical protein
MKKIRKWIQAERSKQNNKWRKIAIKMNKDWKMRIIGRK